MVPLVACPALRYYRMYMTSLLGVCLCTPPDAAISDALESMDMWAEETGVESLQCVLALALAAHPFKTLKKVSFLLGHYGHSVPQSN